MPSRAQSLQRSLNLFRKEGFRCDITERWMSFGSTAKAGSGPRFDSMLDRCISLAMECGRYSASIDDETEKVRDAMVKEYKKLLTPGGTRKDLFGFIDFVALGHGLCVGVQACAADVASHLRKIRGEPNYKRADSLPEGEERDVARDKAAAAGLKIRENLALWLGSGNPVVIVGWRTRKVGKRDLWKPRVIWVTATGEEEFEDQRIAFSSAGLFRERRRA